MKRCDIKASELLTQRLTPVNVEPDIEYPLMGIYGFGRGPIERASVRGADISADILYRVSAGQFIYSRLKAFEGAFTIVPNPLDGRFVSNEFPTFDINVDLSYPKFVGWYFRQPRIWQILASESKGIGARRERLHPEQLMELSISLPSLKEQIKIVTLLERTEQTVAKLRRRRELSSI